eukprot:849541-Rhodomonas_salina.1
MWLSQHTLHQTYNGSETIAVHHSPVEADENVLPGHCQERGNEETVRRTSIQTQESLRAIRGCITPSYCSMSDWIEDSGDKTGHSVSWMAWHGNASRFPEAWSSRLNKISLERGCRMKD